MMDSENERCNAIQKVFTIPQNLSSYLLVFNEAQLFLASKYPQ